MVDVAGHKRDKKSLRRNKINKIPVVFTSFEFVAL